MGTSKTAAQAGESLPKILPISKITNEAVGGKAWGLAKLTQMGMPVPPAFVIINARDGQFPADLDTHYQAIGGGAVAVRSSAIGEDGVASSFAGQYESILNVEGIGAIKAAIAQCLSSLDSHRASAYREEQAQREEQGDETRVEMCVVVQQMVPARAAGVLFTADPVSGRHDRLIIDAVAGIGETLVSGEVTPDHFYLNSDNQTVHSDIIDAVPVISSQEVLALACGARTAVGHYGEALDMEWAIDQAGQLFWLQARPITTLASDLNELDTPIPDDQVITRCNVGEMMPGAVCPLTFSTQGRAIEHGMQHMHVEYGGRPAITDEWTQINMFYGHLFINLSAGLDAARNVSISNADTIAQSLCGRPIPELKNPDNMSPWWRRLYGSWQFFYYCYKAQRVITEFESRFKHMHIQFKNDSRSMMLEMEEKFHWLLETDEVHLRSSATSGVMEGIIQSIVSKGQMPPTSEQQAEAAKWLAGAEQVESAVMVEHLDEVIDLIAEHEQAVEKFQKASAQAAYDWLCGDTSGAAAQCFSDFLKHHGHRSVRELCVREKAWVDEPLKLIVTMQTALAARWQPGYSMKQVEAMDVSTQGRLLRWALPKAHNAIRRREHTKSLLVEATHRLKRGYRHLGKLLTEEGRLDDEDQLFFFTREELKAFVLNPQESDMDMDRASARRLALAFHEKLSFDEISVGKAEPIEFAGNIKGGDDELVGRPVSRGVVEGVARVALTVEEAALLQPGEILIAPITDIGWTPYFSLIAGLATDVGSAVSHGAVIAREYGLPAIVNLHSATKSFSTGDRVRLDADRGVLSRL